MTSLYEGMFLLDNQVVRQDWSKAKSIVTDLLEKHGATIKTARRWDERRLAYPIKKRNRATFLLTYSEIPAEGIATLRRDLELSEDILRYLFLSTDEVPEEEMDLTKAEGSDEFVVPLPPEDHEIDELEEAPNGADDPAEDATLASTSPEPKAQAAEEAPAEEAAAETTEEAPAAEAEKKEEA